MKVLVTGAAGFIGSHLVESLCDDGASVIGLDSLTDYYDPTIKRSNVAVLGERFTLVEDAIGTADLRQLLDGVEQVYHLAGQPGVRGSWRSGFETYVTNNVLATQQLLEACRDTAVSRIVYASSSSVYGNALRRPTSESVLPQPISPYGVSKLAAEHLCGAYAANFGLSVVSVRYFTVFGPRQRPDMAIGRLISAALTGSTFPMYGDGEQQRDFTFVADAVAATRAAGIADVAGGSVFNVGGGSSNSMRDVVELVERATGKQISLEWLEAQPGDARHTGADTTLAAQQLGWRPHVSLAEGITRQVDAARP